MKKFLLLLMIVATIIPVFAQNNSWEDKRQNAFTFNPGAFIIGTTLEGFGIGVAYEYALLSQFSVKANAYFLGYEPGQGTSDGYGYYGQTQPKTDGFTSTAMFAVEGRWYPLERFLEGVFISGGLQYHLLAGTVAFSYYDYDKGYYYDKQFSGAYHTLGLFTGLGYKVVFGKSRFGLAIEPTIDYIWPFYCGIPNRDDALDHNTLAMSAMGIKGFRLGLQVGMAF